MVQKKFWSKNFFDPNKNFGPKKNVAPKNNYGPKNPKKVSPKLNTSKLSLVLYLFSRYLGHYPIVNGGRHKDYTGMSELVWPVMKRHGVDYYLAGHDHNLQHWVEKDNPHGGVEHVISGAGGKSR